jgi:UDP-N-acetylglucosamine 2-epimerase (non-hydrolysing)
MPRVMVHLIAAARPNFMKIAPLYHALRKQPWANVKIVHTGQHYDPNMSDAFFRDLNLPAPDVHLEVGSGSHAQQTGNVMIAYEKAIEAERPDWIIVVGDVNSTAACAMVGAKSGIPVVHLEAGLRSRDRRMPEEINRLVTDAIADVFWTPSVDADENLRSEGVPAHKIDFVGNIMIDSYEMLRNQIESDPTRNRMGLDQRNYGVATLHRPSNVDDRSILTELVTHMVAIASELPLIFSVHPRTRKKLVEFGLIDWLQNESAVMLSEPMGYIQFMNLVSGARVVITDSGGVQEESTYLGIPCLTLRENTERPITVTEGTNRLVRPDQLRATLSEVLADNRRTGRRPQKWDGRTADRCVQALAARCGLDVRAH